MNTFCLRCGRPLGPQLRFCDGCGAPVPGATAQPASNYPPPPPPPPPQQQAYAPPQPYSDAQQMYSHAPTEQIYVGTPPPPVGPSSKTGILIAACAVALVLCAGGLWYVVQHRTPTSKSTIVANAPAAPPAMADPVPSTPALPPPADTPAPASTTDKAVAPPGARRSRLEMPRPRTSRRKSASRTIPRCRLRSCR